MVTTRFQKAERLQKLPPYLFAEIDRKKKAALAAGRDVINLGSSNMFAGADVFTMPLEPAQGFRCS